MSSLPYAQLCRQFSLDEILSATQNFDDALVVGKGGFGNVYKGTITNENGETFIVAIKRLNIDSSQGATEFRAEIEMLTKLRHCNLVSLIGYCNEDSEMILIYEFMPHGTLDDHLHKKGTSLSWVQRLKISIGAARGLHYLHTGTGTQHGVIHRDVKSTNILLDKDYAAKISDFGLAKIGPTNTSSAYVKTKVRGTFGYLDPDYFLTGRLTRKSDVFAFGVVLFELLCGRVAVDNRLDDDESSLVNWAREAIKKGKVHNIIDLKIKSQISPKCLKEFVQIAYNCLNSESENRPKMAEIVVALEFSLSLQSKFDSPVKPAAGILSIGRIIKWRRQPVIPPKVNSDKSEVSSAGKIQILAYGLKKFSFDDLKTATRNFNQNMRPTLGGGEFGLVFRGEFGTEHYTSSSFAFDGISWIAIKRFHHYKIQHRPKENGVEEYFVDMRFLSKLNHPNLVKVLGYCFEDETLFLIYEFMENGSLDSHLFTRYKIQLQWKTRVKIAKGIAEALLFLHTTHNQVDDFSIKIHQILLDMNFNAKISDFESVKLVYGDSFKEIEHGNNSEYEGIVRSFGVLLIQIITGERISNIHIANLRQNMWNPEGEVRKMSLRRVLDHNIDDATIMEAMKLALDCVSVPSFPLKKAVDVLTQIYTHIMKLDYPFGCFLE